MPRFVLKSSLLAWGLPLLPIGAVLIYDLGSYTGDEGYCWLRPTVFYASVLGPIAALMLVNLCFFAFVVRSIFTSGRGLRTNQSESKQTRDKLIACLFNFIILLLVMDLWIFCYRQKQFAVLFLFVLLDHYSPGFLHFFSLCFERFARSSSLDEVL